MSSSPSPLRLCHATHMLCARLERVAHARRQRRGAITAAERTCAVQQARTRRAQRPAAHPFCPSVLRSPASDPASDSDIPDVPDMDVAPD